MTDHAAEIKSALLQLRDDVTRTFQNTSPLPQAEIKTTAAFLWASVAPEAMAARHVAAESSPPTLEVARRLASLKEAYTAEIFTPALEEFLQTLPCQAEARAKLRDQTRETVRNVLGWVRDTMYANTLDHLNRGLYSGNREALAGAQTVLDIMAGSKLSQLALPQTDTPLPNPLFFARAITELKKIFPPNEVEGAVRIFQQADFVAHRKDWAAAQAELRKQKGSGGKDGI